MGVDLRLLPFDSDSGNWAFSHTILNYDLDYDVYDKIKKLDSMPVPKDFSTFSGHSEDYEETCYGNTQETPYGERVRYVLAGDLAKINPCSDWWQIQAVWAYLKAMPPETKVALYWH